MVGHTATLVQEEEGVVIVIGGVASDLSFQTRVMAYEVGLDAWEVWPPISAPLTGIAHFL